MTRNGSVQSLRYLFNTADVAFRCNADLWTASKRRLSLASHPKKSTGFFIWLSSEVVLRVSN
jgi:hypothetical protein